MSTVFAIEPKLNTPEGQTTPGPKITSSIMYVGSTSLSEFYRVQVDTGVPFLTVPMEQYNRRKIFGRLTHHAVIPRLLLRIVVWITVYG